MKPDDNLIKTVNNLLTLLEVNVTNTSIDKIRLHPQYPTILCLSDSLREWNINSMGVKITAEKLTEIPYPAIAHFNGQGFVILKSYQKNEVEYLDIDGKQRKEHLNDFETKWTGVTLLVEPSNKSGEPDYNQKRQNERFHQVIKYLLFSLSTLILSLPLLMLSRVVFPLYLTSIAGIVVSVLLLKKQFGLKDNLVSSICGLGKEADCDAVINSKHSKIFGEIHLSELAILYFPGCAIVLAISAIAQLDMLPCMLILTLVALPFSIFGVLYQWRVVKKWCPLCLMVVAILWSQSAFFLFNPVDWALTLPTLFAFTISFFTPSIFWLSVRHQYIKSFGVATLEKKLFRFTKGDRTFQTLLEAQMAVEYREFTRELRMGKKDAPVSIILVSSPVCSPCFYAHKIVEDMQKLYESDLNIVFRFAIPSDAGSLSYRVINHIAGKLLTDSPHEALKAVSKWYSESGRIDFDIWAKEFPVQGNIEPDKIRNIVLEHSLWCSEVGINSTPTIFINGKKLPEEFSVADLPFQIRKIIDDTTVPESVS